ncbi:DUF302 domain-containing protein [Nocardioides sp.]|uniref:DUF302 domain-containing protein n=1 Tax=Nocardioides sp. TaxID=35761 RepID=UPI00238BAFD5|nr:DUF302 domain-containing protein [Nocardioides sp.]MDE0776660.1 DUF302 domain-containing protein [Nocardioides sp.]
MTDFTLRATTSLEYDDALALVRSLLADAGFGVLTEIDIRATLKTKLDVDVAPQVILGACRPQLAHVALEAEPSIAALLPCNVVVRALPEGGSVVEAVDPDVMMSVAGDGSAADALRTVATDARQRLTQALGALPGQTVEAH